MYYHKLRDANKARQKEWDKLAGITDSYRGNELAGEVGEALDEAVRVILVAAAAGRANNIIKKIERERLGIRGSRASVEELQNELADVIICVDLVAMKYDLDMEVAVAKKFNLTSEKNTLETRMFTGEEKGAG